MTKSFDEICTKILGETNYMSATPKVTPTNNSNGNQQNNSQPNNNQQQTQPPPQVPTTPNQNGDEELMNALQQKLSDTQNGQQFKDMLVQLLTKSQNPAQPNAANKPA